MQKTSLKKAWYSKNETILNIGKNGLHEKAIAIFSHIQNGLIFRIRGVFWSVFTTE